MVVIELLLPYLLPICLCLFTISLWRYYVNSLRDSNSSLMLPPGSVGLPFVGETPLLALKGFNFYSERREKYGHVYKTHILGKPTIRVWGKENIQKVLKNEDTLVTMNWPTSVVELIGSNSLMNSTRRLHSKRRSSILKAFSKGAINGYATEIENLICKRIQTWCNKGKVMAMEECKCMCFEVTARVLLGCEFSQQQMHSMLSNLETINQNLFVLPIDIPGFGFHKGKKARHELVKTIKQIIQQRDFSKPGVDALSILKSEVDSGFLAMEELVDHIVETFFSSSSGLLSLCCSMLNQLATRPDVTEKLTKELSNAQLLQEGTITMATMSELPYLQSVINELLRYIPPVGGGFRQVLKTFELEGYQIPKGWTLLYSIRDNNETDEYFSCPDKFDPERWMDCNKDSDAFIPFGGNGVRSCIGKRYVLAFIQTFICQMIRHSHWDLIDPETKYSSFPVPLPTNGLPLNITAVNHKLKSH